MYFWCINLFEYNNQKDQQRKSPKEIPRKHSPESTPQKS